MWNTWQWSMALGLGASSIASAVMWRRACKRFSKQAFFKTAPPPAIRFGWTAAVAPLVEAWVLWMGGFWA